METLKKLGLFLLKVFGFLVLLLAVVELFFFNIITANGIATVLVVIGIILSVLIFLLNKRGGKSYGALGNLKSSLLGIFQRGQTSDGGNTGTIVPLLVLWGAFLLVLALGNPSTWNSWVSRGLGYFIATQITAVALIVSAAIQDTNKWKKVVGVVILELMVASLFYYPEEKKQTAVSKTSATATQMGITGKLCWRETEKSMGGNKGMNYKRGCCFSAKMLEYTPTYLLIKFTVGRVSGTCEWDKLKDPQYGEWKQTGWPTNGGRCMLIRESPGTFTGWFESHYNTKGEYLPGYQDKYYVDFKIN